MQQQLAQLYAALGQPVPPGLEDSTSAVCEAPSAPYNDPLHQTPAPIPAALRPETSVTGSGGYPPGSVNVFCSFCGFGQPVSHTGQCVSCSLPGLLSLPPARGRVAEQPASKAPIFKVLPAGEAVAEAMGRRPQASQASQFSVPHPPRVWHLHLLRRLVKQRQQSEARLQHGHSLLVLPPPQLGRLLYPLLPLQLRGHQSCPLVLMVHMGAQIVPMTLLGKSQTRTSVLRRSCSRASSGPRFQIMPERSLHGS